MWNGDDCDDTDNTKFPDAICQNDKGCWGALDKNCFCESTTEPLTWCEDSDGDGFGTWEGSVVTCQPPEKWVTSCGDCDDNDSTKFPEAWCQDNFNCDGWLNERCDC